MAVAEGAGTVGPGVEGCVAAGVGGKLELAGVVWPGVWLRVLVLVSRRGREVQFRKIQVLAVVSFWSFYLYRQVLHTHSLSLSH